jgi:hypothetical protein
VTRELGAVRREYRPAERWLMPGMAIAMSLLAVLFVYLAIRFPPVRYDWITFVVMLVLSGGLAVLFAWATRASRDDRVFLHEHGLRIVSIGITRSVAWDEIAAITTVGAATPRQTVLTLWLEDGASVRVLGEPVENNEAFVAAVEDAVVRERAPIVVDQLERDHAVSFGPVVLRATGIRHGDRVLPWDRFAKVAEHDGKLAISATDGEWSTLEADMVSNVALLAALLRVREQR